MRYRILFPFTFIMIFAACTKDNNSANTTPINTALKADYAYKPGTYWIYKDSVTGSIDSAYVYSVTDTLAPKGCVGFKGQPLFEIRYTVIRVNDGNPADSETWQIFLEDSTFRLSFTSNRDNIENYMGYNLFTYPIRTGAVYNASSCLLAADSGGVINIFNQMSVNNNSFSNTASCNRRHQNTAYFYYSDWFYVSPDAGLVKIVFNHPMDSVCRVLQLQRYHIVK